jgi:hypothetical protein
VFFSLFPSRMPLMSKLECFVCLPRLPWSVSLRKSFTDCLFGCIDLLLQVVCGDESFFYFFWVSNAKQMRIQVCLDRVVSKQVNHWCIVPLREEKRFSSSSTTSICMSSYPRRGFAAFPDSSLGVDYLNGHSQVCIFSRYWRPVHLWSIHLGFY